MTKRWQPSPQDLALFRAAVVDVTPLHPSQRAETFRALTRTPRLRATVPSKLEDGFAEMLAEPGAETGEFLEFMRPGLQQRVFGDLRRGQLAIERALDLHGLTLTHAKTVLAEFLADCQRRRHRCIHIIHGKGRGSAGQPPVLKHQVNLWLRQRRDVMAFCSSLPRDGGTGAIYVLLRPLPRPR
jgi:DNA-nicking Smr family endonuclease